MASQIFDYGPSGYGKSKDEWIKDIASRLSDLTIQNKNGHEHSVKIKTYVPKIGFEYKICAYNPYFDK